jgi:uncharacterized membrane protein (UPF0127 family)
MSHPIKLINPSSPQRTVIKVKFCDDFLSRLRGFTFRKNLALDEGLVLAEKRDSRLDTSIHMLFVWTDLAVFWVDSTLTVVDKTLAKSWRPYYASRAPARYVIELHSSRLDDLQVGDRIEFSNE